MRLLYWFAGVVILAAFIVAVFLPYHCYQPLGPPAKPGFCTGAGSLLRGGIVLGGVIAGVLIGVGARWQGRRTSSREG